jgi:predicted acylesterase/phospholipase RssA
VLQTRSLTQLINWIGPAVLGVLLVSLFLTGCKSEKVAAPPPNLIHQDNLIDVAAVASQQPNVEKATVQALQQVQAQSATAPNPQQKSWNVLALSGAGQFAAYAAGILVAWRQRGDCPDFDVYTGISSGAIVALLGSLGPKYDNQLETLITTLKFDELFSYRPLVYNITQRNALANPKGVVKLIEKTVNDEFLADLAEVHRRGKRLFVGTMLLNTRRLVVWDVGAIAASCQPNRKELIHKILLASCSITGFVPPVPIRVTVDGVEYEELHCDAGALAQTFIRFGEQTPTYDPNNPGKPWLPNSNLYIIAGGKLYANPLPPNPNILGITISTISATLYGLFRADLWRLYTFCAVSGMKFHFSYVDSDVDLPSQSMTFDPAVERKVFELGREFITSGKKWRATPPGLEPGEAEQPRQGVEFRTGTTAK